MKIKMYKTPGCFKCINGQTTLNGFAIRCSCSFKKSKEYKRFLNHKEQLMLTANPKEFTKYQKSFYDNNSHIKDDTKELVGA